MINKIDMTNGQNELLAKYITKRNFQISQEHMPIVREILADVEQNGDEAVIKYTARFDCKDLTTGNMKVTKIEIDKAYSLVSDETKDVIRTAIERVRAFHEKQKQNSWIYTEEIGSMLGQLIRPLDMVGLYVPGGKAAYPSSVIMTAVPAKTAGVKRLIVTTPPGKDGTINPVILVAAKEAGVDEIYKVGGAQAVAAMAYGTQTIPKVDKIVGPGNIFVTLAKKMVYGIVDIDMMAGPSEILIIADETANPEYVAADMLSQAEHDESSAGVLVTVSKELALKVEEEIKKQVEKLPRLQIVKKSLQDYGCIITANSLDEAVEIANRIAPEHLELCIKEPVKYFGKIKNAGAIFVGNYTPEPIGDYMAGPSHVLPTNGTARFYSPVSVDQFIKKTSLLWFDKVSMTALGDKVIKFAELEGLGAHANSIRVRLKGE